MYALKFPFAYEHTVLLERVVKLFDLDKLFAKDLKDRKEQFEQKTFLQDLGVDRFIALLFVVDLKVVLEQIRKPLEVDLVLWGSACLVRK